MWAGGNDLRRDRRSKESVLVTVRNAKKAGPRRAYARCGPAFFGISLRIQSMPMIRVMPVTGMMPVAESVAAGAMSAAQATPAPPLEVGSNMAKAETEVEALESGEGGFGVLLKAACPNDAAEMGPKSSPRTT